MITIRSLSLAIPFAVLATGCLDSEPPATHAAALIAEACAIDEIAVATALKPDTATPGEDAPAPGPGTDPDPDPDPDPGSDTLGTACCVSTDGSPCHPMDYSPKVCTVIPDETQAVVLAAHSQFIYTGDGYTTQYYETCPTPPGEPPPPPQCTVDQSAYVFTPYASTRWAVTLEADPSGLVIGTLYAIPVGAVAVRAETGLQLFPALHHGEPYANPRRPVPTPDGEEELDDQNDCLARMNACGWTCGTC